jgi:choline dehydrogenase-like flavoprotein
MESDMLIDGRGIADGATIDADLCIVGAGAAGITLAHELRCSGLRICLLESGGDKADPLIESLSEGENEGEHCVAVTSRQRTLGGATNLWGGNSAPFDPIDFEARNWVSRAAWPFQLSELAPYYQRAQRICQLGPCDYRTEFWSQQREDVARRLAPLSGDGVKPKWFQRMTLRFAEFYRQTLEESGDPLSVIHNATCLRLQTSTNGQQVQLIEAGTLDGNRFQIRALQFVLAAGLENSRLLLLSNDVCSSGLGNACDNVGRCFMLHLNFPGGILRTTPTDRDLSLYGVPLDLGEDAKRTTQVFAGFQIDGEQQRQHKLLNYVGFPGPMTVMAPHYPFLLNMAGLDQSRPRSFLNRAVRAGLRRLRIDSPHQDTDRRQFPGVYALRNWVEQAPRMENRITLGKSRDAFGMPRVRANWTIGNLEKQTIHKSHAILANEFRRSGIGELTSRLPPVESRWPDYLAHASHFMGETRMSHDPHDGVVNEDCRVHGVDNLFIAGGSVFPTGGATMATYNIVALAVRLADHLKQSSSHC